MSYEIFNVPFQSESRESCLPFNLRDSVKSAVFIPVFSNRCQTTNSEIARITIQSVYHWELIR
ncbi:hypothetical protein BH11VER1_BH11VER1_02870 [soil metagenome]